MGSPEQPTPRTDTWTGSTRKEEIPLHSVSANGITTSPRTGWDSNPRYAINVHTLSRLENIGRDSDKMSSFHYDGPRNVLCTPAPMSRDVRIQPTPEPTPVWVGMANR